MDCERDVGGQENALAKTGDRGNKGNKLNYINEEYSAHAEKRGEIDCFKLGGKRGRERKCTNSLGKLKTPKCDCIGVPGSIDAESGAFSADHLHCGNRE